MNERIRFLLCVVTAFVFLWGQDGRAQSKASSQDFVINATSQETLDASLHHLTKTLSYNDFSRLNQIISYLQMRPEFHNMSREAIWMNIRGIPFANAINDSQDLKFNRVTEFLTIGKGNFFGQRYENFFQNVSPILHGKRFHELNQWYEQERNKYNPKIGLSHECGFEKVGDDTFVQGLALRQLVDDSVLTLDGSKRPAKRVDVTIAPPERRLFLVLTAVDYAVVNLHVLDGAELAGVLIVSKYPVVLGNVPDGVPVHQVPEVKDYKYDCTGIYRVNRVGPKLLAFDEKLKKLIGRGMDRFAKYDRPRHIVLSDDPDFQKVIEQNWMPVPLNIDQLMSFWPFTIDGKRQKAAEYLHNATLDDLVADGYLQLSNLEEYDEVYGVPTRNKNLLRDLNILVPTPSIPIYRVLKPFSIMALAKPFPEMTALLAEKASDLGMRRRNVSADYVEQLNIRAYIGDRGVCLGNCTAACIGLQTCNEVSNAGKNE